MKKPGWLWVVVCFLWSGCQVTGPRVGREGTGQQGSALISLPPLQTYPSREPMPVGSFTHLVVGRCGEDGRFMAEAVNAPRGTIIARWVGYSDAASSAFLAQAWSAGVPVTVYPERVLVHGAPPPPTGSPQDVFYDPCDIPVAGQVPDEPPSDPGPQGDEQLWDVFSFLALDTSHAIDTVSSPAP